MTRRTGFKAEAAGKYGAKKVRIDGRLFDSTLEGARYLQLRDMEKRGEIRELACQVKFRLTGNDGKRIADYYADFVYIRDGDNEQIVEDVKGMVLSTFKLKAAVLEACHGVRVEVIKTHQIPSYWRKLATDIRDLGLDYRTEDGK